jgi:hypothetical protein
MAALKVQLDRLKMSYPTELEEYLGEAIHQTTVSEIIREASAIDVDDELAGVEGSAEYGEGMLIDLTKLPTGIKKLRIYMS